MTILALYASNAEKPGKPIFNEFQSPVGKVVYCYHDTPQLEETDSKPPKPVMDENGIQKANYKVTLWWPKAEMETTLIAMRALAKETVAQAWGAEALTDPWLNLQPFLRSGDNPEHNTKRKEHLFGGVYLNFKQKAVATRLSDGRILYSGKPGLVGPHSTPSNPEILLPSDMYAGAFARISGIMFGTEYSGKRFISTRLNNIQKSHDGEKLGGGSRPDAASQFDPLQTAPAAGMGFGTTVL